MLWKMNWTWSQNCCNKWLKIPWRGRKPLTMMETPFKNGSKCSKWLALIQDGNALQERYWNLSKIAFRVGLHVNCVYALSCKPYVSIGVSWNTLFNLVMVQRGVHWFCVFYQPIEENKNGWEIMSVRMRETYEGTTSTWMKGRVRRVEFYTESGVNNFIMRVEIMSKMLGERYRQLFFVVQEKSNT